MNGERGLRIDEVAQRTGYKEATIRKKVRRRELGYRKVGRIISIPESEVERLMGDYHAPMLTGEATR